MNVSLTPQLESYLKQKVAGGMYNSVSEVIREALRLQEKAQKLVGLPTWELIDWTMGLQINRPKPYLEYRDH